MSSIRNDQFAKIYRLFETLDGGKGRSEDIGRIFDFLSKEVKSGCEASRIIIQCSILSRGDYLTLNRAAGLYASVILGSMEEMAEYIMVGSVLATVLDLITSTSSIEPLRGFRLILPFTASNLTPAKLSIAVESVDHLDALAYLWCSAFADLDATNLTDRALISTFAVILERIVPRNSVYLIAATSRAMEAFISRSSFMEYYAQSLTRELLRALGDLLVAGPVNLAGIEFTSHLKIALYSLEGAFIHYLEKGACGSVTSTVHAIVGVLMSVVAPSCRSLQVRNTHSNDLQLQCISHITSCLLRLIAAAVARKGFVAECDLALLTPELLVGCCVDATTSHFACVCLQHLLLNSPHLAASRNSNRVMQAAQRKADEATAGGTGAGAVLSSGRLKSGLKRKARFNDESPGFDNNTEGVGNIDRLKKMRPLESLSSSFSYNHSQTSSDSDPFGDISIVRDAMIAESSQPKYATGLLEDDGLLFLGGVRTSSQSSSGSGEDPNLQYGRDDFASDPIATDDLYDGSKSRYLNSEVSLQLDRFLADVEGYQELIHKEIPLILVVKALMVRETLVFLRAYHVAQLWSRAKQTYFSRSRAAHVSMLKIREVGRATETACDRILSAYVERGESDVDVSQTSVKSTFLGARYAPLLSSLRCSALLTCSALARVLKGVGDFIDRDHRTLVYPTFFEPLAYEKVLKKTLSRRLVDITTMATNFNFDRHPRNLNSRDVFFDSITKCVVNNDATAIEAMFVTTFCDFSAAPLPEEIFSLSLPQKLEPKVFGALLSFLLAVAFRISELVDTHHVASIQGEFDEIPWSRADVDVSSIEKSLESDKAQVSSILLADCSSILIKCVDFLASYSRSSALLNAEILQLDALFCGISTLSESCVALIFSCYKGEYNTCCSLKRPELLTSLISYDAQDLEQTVICSLVMIAMRKYVQSAEESELAASSSSSSSRRRADIRTVPSTPADISKTCAGVFHILNNMCRSAKQLAHTFSKIFEAEGSVGDVELNVLSECANFITKARLALNLTAYAASSSANEAMGGLMKSIGADIDSLLIDFVAIVKRHPGNILKHHDFLRKLVVRLHSSYWISQSIERLFNETESEAAHTTAGTLMQSPALLPLSAGVLGESMVMSGRAAFVRRIHLLNPQDAIGNIAEIVKIWIKSDSENYHLVAAAVSSELYALAEAGILYHLLRRHPEITCESLLVPLVWRAVVSPSAASVLTEFLEIVNDGHAVGLVHLLEPILVAEIYYRLLQERMSPSSSSAAASTDLAGLVSVVSDDLGISARRFCLLDEKLEELLYALLAHSFTHKFCEAELVDRVLNGVAILSARLGAVLPSSSTSSSVNSFVSLFRSEATVNRVALLFVWQLGSPSQSMRLQAVRMLRIIAAHLCEKTADAPDPLDVYLPNIFLYSMSNLVQVMFKGEKGATKLERVQSLHVIIQFTILLPADSVQRFLPKMIIILREALTSPCAMLRNYGVTLIENISSKLDLFALSKYLSTFLVLLFPIVENSCESGNEIAIAQSDLDALSLPPGTSKPRVDALTFANCSQDLSLLFEVLQASKSGALATAKAAERAIRLIDKLAQEDPESLEFAMRSIATVPSVRGLERLVAIHKRVSSALTIKGDLSALCDELHHESAIVRAITLTRISQLCLKHHDKVYDTIDEAEVQGAASDASGNLIVRLVGELLRLCAREGEPEVLIEAGKTLGIIGAIDPARLSSLGSLSLSLSSSSSQADSQDAAPQQNSSAGMLIKKAPWDWPSMEIFGLSLLEHYLVPILKASDTSQDRIHFAIQNVLKAVSPTSNSAAGLFSSSSADSSEMPQSLRGQLSRFGILETVEPFWSTRYSLTDKRGLQEPPFYKSGIDFTRWIGIWVRYLASAGQGPTRPFAEACKGAVRTRADLSQFLLPYLIMDVLLQPANDSEYKKIVQEIHLVLSNGGSEGRETTNSVGSSRISETVSLKSSSNFRSDEATGGDMAVQAIFEVIDVLSLWVAKKISALKKKEDSSTEEWRRKFAAVNMLLADIPKELLGSAALRIKAYARAIRYFETSARDEHRNRRLQAAATLKTSKGLSSSSQDAATSDSVRYPSRLRNDGSCGELPHLSQSQLDILMLISSRLEDADTLQGVQVLRHINGYSSTAWTRIMEYEQTEDWLGALTEYNLLHSTLVSSSSHMLGYGAQSPGLYTKSSGFDSAAFDGSGFWSAYKTLPQSSRSKTPPTIEGSITASMRRDSLNSSTAARKARGGDDARVSDTRSGARKTPHKNVIASPSGDAIWDHRNALDENDIVEVERGRLRCLIELGHYDSVVDQMMGMTSRMSALENVLLPVGVEATWRLMSWDELDTFIHRIDSIASPEDMSGELDYRAGFDGSRALPPPHESLRPRLGEDNFQISLGKLLLCLNTRDSGRFQAELTTALKETMVSLSAAAKESYGRAYSYISRLHILHEVSDGLQLMKLRDQSAERQHKLMQKHIETCQWKRRLSVMPASPRQRSMLLAVRRSIMGSAGLMRQVAENWLELSKAMRKIGKFEASKIALRRAQISGLGPETENITLIQECRILKESGQINEALMLLEPVEISPNSLSMQMEARSQDTSGAASIAKSQFLERVLLATQLMVESRQKHGNVIVDRYRKIIELMGNNEANQLAQYELGRYLERLYHDIKAKEDDDDTASAAAYLARLSSSRNQRPSSSGSNDGREAEKLSYNYVVDALTCYGNCLRSSSNKFVITQTLPRMLTLWFSFTALSVSQSQSGSAGSSGLAARSLEDVQRKVNDVMASFCGKISMATWFSCMPQLVSRLGHTNGDTLAVINFLLERVLATFPQQGIWHIASVLKSFNIERMNIGRAILEKAKKKVAKTSADDAEMLASAGKLFDDLVRLAGSAVHTAEKIKTLNFPIGRSINLTRFLVPNQRVLMEAPSLSGHQLKRRNEGDISYSGPANANYAYIKSFHEQVGVGQSKARPKTLTLTTTCGKTIKFLCKQETDGDLRKDARMMEFNTVVNNVLQENPASRSRSLRLRTYAVVCLNEECGILEWVNNTCGIRGLITAAHQLWPTSVIYPNPNSREVYESLKLIQQDFDKNKITIAQLVELYQRKITDKCKPCFHSWFIETFPDPTEWLEARTRYSRSAAVWSAVGYVIGLGDRHTENIMLDVNTGEVVNVDFDCLFDKGLTLAKPEIVPFRLTPNVVDAMGVTGVEGNFRRSMEVTIRLLRENKDTLLSVLEPFLRDPTVAWSRSGRAQRAERIEIANSSIKVDTSFKDQDNADAKAALLKISGRLDGVYNIVHPRAVQISMVYKMRKLQPPSRGLGASKEEEFLALSYQGQVQRLIEEATSEENLAQMFMGWSPWM